MLHTFSLVGRRGMPCIALLLGVFATGAIAEDWAQWRGPDGNGISKETGWNATNPKKLWETQVGAGCSSFAVSNGRVYTMGYDDAAGEDVLYCWDAESGKELWQYGYGHAKWANSHDGGPAGTPAVHDGRVYTFSREAKLHCINAETGDPIWHKDLMKEFGVRPPQWGFSGSPVIYKDMLIVDSGVIAALKPDSGEVIWKTANYGSAYSTPHLFTQGRNEALACFPESGLVILNFRDGRELGRYPWQTRHGVNAATPIISGDLAFISSGYNTGGALVKLSPGTMKEVWNTKEMRNHFASSVLWEGKLYGFDETQLKCMDLKTGEVHWSERGLGKGSLMMADGKLIVMSDKGQLVIAPVSPSGFKPLSQTPAVSGATAWVVPVLANGKIYCRNNRGSVAVFDVK